MNNKAILCVDDEPIILDSLKEQLQKRFGSDYYYETAENATEALEVVEELSAEEIKVLVIVSDWLMPGIKGDEFLIQIHKKFPKIVKVMLTGQADSAAIDNAIKNANLHACIFKPWSEDELVNIIRTGLDKL